MGLLTIEAAIYWKGLAHLENIHLAKMPNDLIRVIDFYFKWPLHCKCLKGTSIPLTPANAVFRLPSLEWKKFVQNLKLAKLHRLRCKIVRDDGYIDGVLGRLTKEDVVPDWKVIDQQKKLIPFEIFKLLNEKRLYLSFVCGELARLHQQIHQRSRASTRAPTEWWYASLSQ